MAGLRTPGLHQLAEVEKAYGAVASGMVSVIAASNRQIAELQQVVSEHFGRQPAAEIVLSQPGLGEVLSAASSASSATTRAASPTPERARTTPAKARSLEHPARRRSCSP